MFCLSKSLKPVPKIYPVEATSLPIISGRRIQRLYGFSKRINISNIEVVIHISSDIYKQTYLKSLNQADCPLGYSFSRHKDCVVYYKFQSSNFLKLLNESVGIDQDLHVKRFYQKSTSTSTPMIQKYRAMCVKKKEYAREFSCIF